jgi:hypothetical protein
MNHAAFAAEVLDQACTRHGGLDAFARTTRLELRLEGLGGMIPRMKGLGWTFPQISGVDLFPHERRAVFLDYPERNSVGVFSEGRVALGSDPTALPGGGSHRSTFGGFAKWRMWRPEDALYFFGYALLDYVSLPFSLLERELVDAGRSRRGAELWFRFPTGSDTHSSVQGFFFDESGLLVRHDYRAEVIGSIFNGAHMSREYVQIGGLSIATRRTVYAKPWHYPVRWVLPMPVLYATVLPRS